MSSATEREALETYERYVALRDEIDRGRKPWSALADFFTEDAVYIDPGWGRIEGRESIRTFFERSMAGLSILYYVGDGLFCYSHDMLNMKHIGETMRAMGWRPPAEFNMPPRQPNRDISLPAAWAHLEKSRAPRPPIGLGRGSR